MLPLAIYFCHLYSKRNIIFQSNWRCNNCSLVVLLLAGIICFTSFLTKAQTVDTNNVIGQIGKYLLYRNHDTNYIANYGDELGIKLLTNNKFNYLKILDGKAGKSLRYRPSRDVSLGIGIVYKWFALDLAFNLGLRNYSQIEGAQAFDFQGRLFSSKQLMVFSLQVYRGYKLENISGLDVELTDHEELRPDMRTIYFGLEYFHALNYTKFSMKAPFVFNEIQRKSAGSPIVGVSFGIYSMTADSSLVPPKARNSLQSAAQMRDLSLINGALNFGYMYTFVYKSHYFASLGLIPGININGGDFFDESEQKRKVVPLNAHFKINSLNSIGYNGRKYFGGLSLIFDASYARLANNLTSVTGRGVINLFVGIRFDAPKIIR